MWKPSTPSAFASAAVFLALLRTNEPSPNRLFFRAAWDFTTSQSASQGDEQHTPLYKLIHATRAGRDKAFDAAIRTGVGGTDIGMAGLRARWEHAAIVLRDDSVLPELKRLELEVDKLDAARRSVSSFVLGESAAKTDQPPESLTKVETALLERRGLGYLTRLPVPIQRAYVTWTCGRRVGLGELYREACDELEWNRSKQAQLNTVFDLPDFLPAWLEGIDCSKPIIDLREFHRTSDARDKARASRAIMTANTNIFGLMELPGPRFPSSDEFRLLELVNEFRVMMGLSALSWSFELRALSTAEVEKQGGDRAAVGRATARNESELKLLLIQEASTVDDAWVKCLGTRASAKTLLTSDLTAGVVSNRAAAWSLVVGR